MKRLKKSHCGFMVSSRDDTVGINNRSEEATMNKSSENIVKVFLTTAAMVIMAIAIAILAADALQRSDIADYKKTAMLLLAADRAPDCGTIMSLEDPLKRHVFAEIICEGKSPEAIPALMSDDEADKLTPRLN